jgi:hypothetical protein
MGLTESFLASRIAADPWPKIEMVEKKNRVQNMEITLNIRRFLFILMRHCQQMRRLVY